MTPHAHQHGRTHLQNSTSDTSMSPVRTTGDSGIEDTYSIVYPLTLTLFAIITLYVHAASTRGAERVLGPRLARGIETFLDISLFGCVLHSIARGVPLEYWAHVLFGAFCCIAAVHVKRYSFLLCLPPYQGGLAACTFVALIVGEVWSVGLGKMHYLAHVLLEVCCLLLTLVAVAGGLTLSDRNLKPQWMRFTAHEVLNARCIIDPVCIATIGVIFIAHRHDPRPIAVTFHRIQAGLLFALAACVLRVSAAVADPWQKGVTAAMRGWHAFLWTLNGVWLLFMAIGLYSLPGRHGLYDGIIAQNDPLEAALVQFALALMVSALLTA